MSVFLQKSKQEGVAFVFVLWVIALLTILLGSFAVLARTENLQARYLFYSTTARYAAEAGINLAVYKLRDTDLLTRWVADGRPYEYAFGETKLVIEITDDAGKIDLNTADGVLLKALFTSVGVQDDKADALSDAIQDWRDPDDLVHGHGAEESEYKAAGLSYKPKNAPFDTVSEVQQVLGMDYEIYHKIEPAITIYSGRAATNPAYAPFEVLRALPGMTDDLARQFLQSRQQMAPGSQAGLTLPNGTPVMADGGGLTYSIKSRATLSNGASAVLDATIRSGGAGPNGRPFAILRWRDGETS